MKALPPLMFILAGCANLSGNATRLPEDVSPLCSPFFSGLPARPAKEKTPGLQEKFQKYLDSGAHAAVLNAARSCWADYLIKNDASREAVLCVRTRFKDGNVLESTVGTHDMYSAPDAVVACAAKAIPGVLIAAPKEAVEVDINQTVTLTLNR